MRPLPLSPVLAQFLRFGVVGTAGFVVDAAVLYAMLFLGAGPYAGRIPAYLAAATTTYALNRRWTFHEGGDANRRQWATFLVLNLGGFVLNYGVYVLLIRYVPLVAAHPLLGVAAGALAGMTGNFVLSRRFVFQHAVAR